MALSARQDKNCDQEAWARLPGAAQSTMRLGHAARLEAVDPRRFVPWSSRSPFEPWSARLECAAGQFRHFPRAPQRAVKVRRLVGCASVVKGVSQSFHCSQGLSGR